MKKATLFQAAAKLLNETMVHAQAVQHQCIDPTTGSRIVQVLDGHREVEDIEELSLHFLDCPRCLRLLCRRVLEARVEQLKKLTPDPDIIELGELTVAENATVEEMTRAGEYDGYKPNIDLICKHFSIIRRGPRKLYLVHFKKDMDTKEVEQAVAAMPDKELALVEDLLAVGAHPKHKELQREFPIFCLGSSAVLRGARLVPCLGGWPDERWLHLFYSHDGWGGGCRFLLVQPSP